MKRTRSNGVTIIDIVNGLAHHIKSLEQCLRDTRKTRTDREILSRRSLGEMEKTQSGLRDREVLRHSKLSDSELRSELEGQYGVTSWAKKVIDQLVANRRFVSDISVSIA